MQCLGLSGVRHFTKITHHSKPSTLLECFHGALEMINETWINWDLKDLDDAKRVTVFGMYLRRLPQVLPFNWHLGETKGLSVLIKLDEEWVQAGKVLASRDIKVLLFAGRFLHLLIYLHIQSTVVINTHSVIRVPRFKSQVYHLLAV